MSTGFELAGQTFPPSSKGIVRLPVTVDLDGGEIAIYVHVLTGAKPGPVLLLTGVQHGDEWGELEMFRRVVRDTDVSQMSGTLLVIPVCSPVALGSLTRITQPSSDGPDLNRVWPGKFNWIPELIAKTITREVLPKVTHLIDFHQGIWGSNIGIIAYGEDYPDPKIVAACREMALAYGYPVVNRGRVVAEFPGPRSMMGYAGAKMNIVGIACEIGGTGWSNEIEEKWLTFNQQGIASVMRHLGMLPGQPTYAKKTLVYSAGHRVEPTKGGLLIPARENDEIGREVKKGEVLGRIVSPYTFEDLEQLIAPCDGVLTIVARTYPVRPGDWAFAVADSTAATSEWVIKP